MWFKKIKGVSRMLDVVLFCNIVLHRSHRSYPSRRRACSNSVGMSGDIIVGAPLDGHLALQDAIYTMIIAGCNLQNVYTEMQFVKLAFWRADARLMHIM